MEQFIREIKEQFTELRDADNVEEMEKFLRNTYRKAKEDGNSELYTSALGAYNHLLYLNGDI